MSLAEIFSPAWFHPDFLGYAAGFCLLMMASMKNQLHMRMFNIAGNILFICYGFVAGLMPVLLLNSIIMTLHVYRIAQARRRKNIPGAA